MTAVVMVAGAVLYPLSVGCAARVWMRLWPFDCVAHRRGWRSGWRGARCGDRVFQYGGVRTVRCPGCISRQNLWVLASLWPVALPVVLVHRAMRRAMAGTVGGVRYLARLTGPDVYTGEEE